MEQIINEIKLVIFAVFFREQFKKYIYDTIINMYNTVRDSMLGTL